MKINYNIQTVIGRYPTIFFPIYRFSKKFSDRLVYENTDIVIEGFGRSANTFAVIAFELSQERKVKIAHHLHVPAQIIRAAKLNIPIILLIRHPVDAIISILIRENEISASQALSRYISFYSRVLGYHQRYILATFEDVIKDFGVVVSKLNKKFNTNFVAFDHTPQNIENVFKIIEELTIREKDNKTGRFSENRVARPSKSRDQLKIQFRHILDSRKYQKSIKAALDIYEKFRLLRK